MGVSALKTVFRNNENSLINLRKTVEKQELKHVVNDLVDYLETIFLKSQFCDWFIF